ncbi:transposase family protein [Salinibacter ruber]|uniref:transposase family protein n=1 Tax=Salinibacter ruber TaxID=146919 RepID=UPI003C6E2086
MPEATLIDSFTEIEDPRHPRNTLYPIEEILLLAICGAISGADDFVSIAEPVGSEARVAPGAPSVRARSAFA